MQVTKWKVDDDGVVRWKQIESTYGPPRTRSFNPATQVAIADDGTRYKVLTPQEYEAIRSWERGWPPSYQTDATYLSNLGSNVYERNCMEGKSWGKHYSDRDREYWLKSHNSQVRFVILESDYNDPNWGEVSP